MDSYPHFGSWADVSGYTDAVAIVVLIMRFFGEPLETWLPKVPRKLWFLLVASIVMGLVAIFTGERTLPTVMLAAFNAFGIALAAFGADNVIVNKK